MSIVSSPATTTTNVAQTVGNPDANIGVIGTAPVVAIGNSTALVGFYGKTAVVQPTAASVTDYASLKVALQALGLIGS